MYRNFKITNFRKWIVFIMDLASENVMQLLVWYV